jgi:hypothetical protein
MKLVPEEQARCESAEKLLRNIAADGSATLTFRGGVFFASVEYHGRIISARSRVSLPDAVEALCAAILAFMHTPT